METIIVVHLFILLRVLHNFSSYISSKLCRYCMKVCWEKFARYFEVELKEVKLREDYFVMDPEKAVEMVDENTICVAAILGSTLNGEFEDVKLLNDLLAEKNSKTGYFLCSSLSFKFCLSAKFSSYQLVYILHFVG